MSLFNSTVQFLSDKFVPNQASGGKPSSSPEKTSTTGSGLQHFHGRNDRTSEGYGTVDGGALAMPTKPAPYNTRSNLGSNPSHPTTQTGGEVDYGTIASDNQHSTPIDDPARPLRSQINQYSASQNSEFEVQPGSVSTHGTTHAQRDADSERLTANKDTQKKLRLTEKPVISVSDELKLTRDAILHLRREANEEKLRAQKAADAARQRENKSQATIQRLQREASEEKTRAEKAAHQREKELQAQAKRTFQSLQGEVKQARAETAYAQQATNTANENVEALRAELAKANELLENVKADREAMRGFFETERVDGQAVITHFNDFVEAVNDLALSLVDEVDEEALTSQVSVERVRDLAKSNKEAADFIISFLEPMAQAQVRVELIAMLVLQSIVFSLLARYVFRPLSLAGDVPQGASQYLQILQECIIACEPQEKYGRWRAITYSAMRATTDNNDKHAQNVASEIKRNIAHLLEALLPTSARTNGTLHRLLEAFDPTRVVFNAIELQDMIQRDYVSYNYEIFLPQIRGRYSLDYMEKEKLAPDATRALRMAIQPSSTILLPLTPGLRATWAGPNQPRSETVLKKASVVVV